MSSVTHDMQEIADEYQREFEIDLLDLDAVSKWAVETNRYQRQPMTLEQQCKRDLARALRTQHIRDAQGREPRRWHAVHISSGPEQLVLWAEFSKAKPNHMRISLQQRRQSILGACKQHKVDTDSYNDNNSFNTTLPLFDYDFNRDLEEVALPEEYPDPNPDPDESEPDDGPETIH